MSKVKKSSITIEQVSSEMEIAILQLERLKQIARERTMTYEEVRIYDILTKNLLLLKGDPTVITGDSSRIEPMKEIEVETLLQIAQTVSEKDIKKVLNFVEEVTDDSSKSTKDN